MPADINRIIALLPDGTDPLSAADRAAQLSVPILTPRTGMVTYTTACRLLGTDRADAILNNLTAIGASQQVPPQAAAFARSASRVLLGSGFDPSEPEAARVKASLVAVGACEEGEADLLFFSTSYAAGSTVTADDVAAARQEIADRKAAELAAAQADVDAKVAAARAADDPATYEGGDGVDDQWGKHVYGVGRAEILRRQAAGEPVPTVDEVLAFVAAARGEG